jgi:predicted TIM-barrel fold metal-dependent hydrolase
MAIIDTRLRPPTDQFKNVHRGASPTLAEWWDWSVDELVEEMEALDITGVVAGRVRKQGSVSNEHLKELGEKYPGRFMFIGSVDYNDRHGAQEEIDRIAGWGFKGVGLELVLQKEVILPDDRRLYPIYAQCEDLGLVCSIQTSPTAAGLSLWNNSPYAIDQVAADFRLLRILLPHACWPLVEEVVHLLWRRPNVWISHDCYIHSPFSNKYVEAVNYAVDEPEYPIFPMNFTRLQNRYVYGSCLPNSPPPRERLEEFKNLGWREELLDKLLYGNAAKLFGLEGDITSELRESIPSFER